jgi:hypothetical protein
MLSRRTRIAVLAAIEPQVDLAREQGGRAVGRVETRLQRRPVQQRRNFSEERGAAYTDANALIMPMTNTTRDRLTSTPWVRSLTERIPTKHTR